MIVTQTQTQPHNTRRRIVGHGLFWKEWRESWPLIIAAPALLAALYGADVTFYIANAHPHTRPTIPVGDLYIILALVWLLSAVLTGSSFVSAESGSGTLLFLSSLPIKRRTIFWKKTASLLSIHLASCLVAAIAWELLNTVTTNHSLMQSVPIGIDGIIWFLPLTIFAFVVAVQASILTDRTITAVGISGLSIVAIFFGVGLITSPLSSVTGIPEVCFMIAGWVFASLLALFTSYQTFVHGQSLSPGQKFRILFRKGLLYRLFDIGIIIAALSIAFWILVS